jgi:hypothetical protein
MVYAVVEYESYWTISSGKFQARGTNNSEINARLLTMKDSINLSSYPAGQVAVHWTQSKTGTLEATDTLYYAVSANGGTTWSENYEAFSGNSPATPFYAIVPGEYMTGGFKLRYYYNFNASDEYVQLDNINLYYIPPDTSITFKVWCQHICGMEKYKLGYCRAWQSCYGKPLCVWSISWKN